MTSLEQLQGKVVLLDFWTYSCVNCLRTLPYLRAWHERYSDEGLVIIGIHSPEFAFEKSRENVEQATRERQVPWLVALDNDRKTWDAFYVRAWPTKILLGPDGSERYRVLGEGEYEEMEKRIRLVLVEAGTDVNDAPTGLTDPSFDGYEKLTREIYGGWKWESENTLQSLGLPNLHNYLANPGEVGWSQTGPFAEPEGVKKRDGVYYLSGVWERQAESVRHARRTEDYVDSVSLLYNARVINAVIRPQGEVPFRVLVTLDGKPLTTDNHGADVLLEDGKSYIAVSSPRLYEIVAAQKMETHELRLSVASDSFSLHSFTFGI